VHSQKLLDHFSNPRNVGEALPESHRIAVENPICGDQIRLSVRVENGRVEQVAFRTRGCTASIACSSALTELLQGLTRAELRVFCERAATEVEAAVDGLIPESKHAAVLCADAAKALAAAWRDGKRDGKEA
jgi:nitrogen fixation NifU-like protein